MVRNNAQIIRQTLFVPHPDFGHFHPDFIISRTAQARNTQRIEATQKRRSTSLILPRLKPLALNHLYFWHCLVFGFLVYDSKNSLRALNLRCQIASNSR